MLLKMLGAEPLELTMPWLRGGPYTAEPGAVFEVAERDGLLLLEGNARLFQSVDGPEKGLATEREEADWTAVLPSVSPVEEKPRRRKKAAPEAAGKGE